MKKSPECLDLIYYGAVAKPDADIAGLGVIIAFTFSATSKDDRHEKDRDQAALTLAQSL
jgi:hypothetical protein